MSETTPRQRLYALYVDATQVEAGATTWSQRRQYIVMPPAPETLNGSSFAPGGGRTSIGFSRTQERPDHRAVWRAKSAPNWDSANAQTIREELNRMEQRGWKLSPVMVVELLPEELDDARTGKTPWPVLNRIKKVARRRFGMDV